MPQRIVSTTRSDFNPILIRFKFEFNSILIRFLIRQPYVVTSDVTVPALTITASDDNWMTTLYSGASAQGQVIPTLHTF